jgi:hypothetical protein
MISTPELPQVARHAGDQQTVFDADMKVIERAANWFQSAD